MINNLTEGKPLKLLDVYKRQPEDRAGHIKKIVVAGGGISGCEAAIVAAMRGHQVILAEREARLGGQWIAAGIPCSKADFPSFVSWQKHMLLRLGVTPPGCTL